MWLRHWNLVRDPFSSAVGVYVATPPHDEVVARLVYAIRSRERLAIVQGESGLGKSVALTRALKEARSPGLRISVADAPADGPSLYEQLARSLRIRLKSSASDSRSEAWRALADAARLIAAQQGRLVLAVDSAHHLHGLADRLDLERLLHLLPGSSVTLIWIEPTDPLTGRAADTLPIRLGPLSRTEANHYLTTKLGLAGRDAPTFVSGALARLHGRANGVPRLLDRLAGLALRFGAIQRLKSISDDVIDAVTQEMGAETVGLPYHEGLGQAG